MNDPAIAAVIEQDLAAARTLGLRKTPSFFVNGEPLREFGYRQLEELVNRAIAAAY
jgi:protein-disulfide isomerase